MDFSHVNYVAVMLAAGASFAFGGLWYGALSKQWMAAAGLEPEDIKPPNGPVLTPYISTFVAELVMAFVLAAAIREIVDADVVTVTAGMQAGILIWLGFVLTSLIVNHAFQGTKKALTLIDGGHWLGVLLLQGAVLGGFGMN